MYLIAEGGREASALYRRFRKWQEHWGYLISRNARRPKPKAQDQKTGETKSTKRRQSPPLCPACGHRLPARHRRASLCPSPRDEGEASEALVLLGRAAPLQRSAVRRSSETPLACRARGEEVRRPSARPRRPRQRQATVAPRPRGGDDGWK